MDACDIFRALVDSTGLRSIITIETQVTSECEFCRHQNVDPVQSSDSVLLLNVHGGVQSVARLASQVDGVEASGESKEPCARCNQTGGRLRRTAVKGLSDVLAVKICRDSVG